MSAITKANGQKPTHANPYPVVKSLLICFAFVLAHAPGHAQYGSVLSLDQLQDTLDLKPYAFVARSLHHDNYTPADSGKLSFIPWKVAGWMSIPGDRKFDYWIRFKISTSKQCEVVWDFNRHWRVHLWAHSDTQDFYREGGFTFPLNKASYPKNIDLVQTKFLPDSLIDILVMIRHFKSKPYPMDCQVITLEAADEYMKNLWASKRRYFNFLSATLGILGFMSVFAFLQFRVHKDKSFLMYSLYLATLFFYFIKLVEYGYMQPLVWGYFNSGYEISEVIMSMLIIIMYCLFVSHFLSIKEKKPGIQKWLNWSVRFSLFFIVVYIIDTFFTEEKGIIYQSYVYFRLGFIVLSLYFIIRMYSLRSPLYYFVVTGSFMLLAGSGIALIIALTQRHAPVHLWQEHYFYFQMGVILEALCFGLGLGYKTHILDLEKQTAQSDLIRQKEKEIVYQKALGEARISNLRARMNPHFIFNAMNSVQHLILDRQNNKAITYLGRFSKLMRKVLDTSEHSFLSLQSEIEILENYISIENLRLVEKFEYQIHAPGDLPLDEILIPQMIIQPFVENAIMHGIKPLQDRNGMVTVEFEMESEDLLRCTITDNGVGRLVSLQSKEKTHESKAIRLTEERLRLLGIDLVTPILIEDLHAPTGTRVIIFLPVRHDF